MPPYRNLTLLSEKGGMAKIYRAYNSEADRQCVLKVMRPELLGDQEAGRKFEREVEILRGIKSKYYLIFFNFLIFFNKDIGNRAGNQQLDLVFFSNWPDNAVALDGDCNLKDRK